MDEKIPLLTATSEAIERLKAKPQRNDYQNEALEILETFLEGIPQMPTEEALEWWKNVFWILITDLEFWESLDARNNNER